MFEITTIFGWLAGIVGFAAFIPYIFAILRGKTTPNRATWIIWTVVSTVSLFSYGASGAEHTIWYPISDALAPFIILLLSIKQGEGGWTQLDRGCLVTAGIGVFFWWLFGSALLGLCMSLLADAMGAIPTMIKVYQRPKSEDRNAWAMTFIAVVLNLGAVENWHSFSILVYPIYMLISMGIITMLIWFPRKNKMNILVHS